MGENGGPGIFRYLGADGKTLNGRGQTAPAWFRGVPPDNLPDDDVPDKSSDFAFGRELSYQHCKPNRVTIDDALDYGEWVFRTTGADGARFDDVKGTWAPFVREFMTHGVMASKFFYSEYFDGNPASLNWWATSGPMESRSLVEDFTLHWALQAACDGGDARVLEARAGYTTWRPDLHLHLRRQPGYRHLPWAADRQQQASGLCVPAQHRRLSDGLRQGLLSRLSVAGRLWIAALDR